MKQIVYLSIALTVSLPLWGMGRFGNFTAEQFNNLMNSEFVRRAGDVVHDVARDVGQIARDRVRERQQRTENQLRDAERRLRDARSDREREIIQEEIVGLRQAEQRSRDGWENLEREMAGLPGRAFGVVFDGIRNQMEADQRLRETAVRADIEGQASVARTREYINAFTNPRNIKLGVAALSATAFAVYAAKYGTELAADLIRHWYRNPTLAQDTSLISLKQKLINKFTQDKQVKLAPKSDTEIANIVIQELKKQGNK